MKVKISTDSTCDLPREFIERYDIGVLPLYIIRDGVSLRDGIEITAEDMYEYTEKTGKELGGEIKILGFVRFEKGEGLEKRTDNFADEVASMVK